MANTSRQVTIRLTNDDERIIEDLVKQTAGNRTSVIRLALRALHREYFPLPPRTEEKHK